MHQHNASALEVSTALKINAYNNITKGALVVRICTRNVVIVARPHKEQQKSARPWQLKAQLILKTLYPSTVSRVLRHIQCSVASGSAQKEENQHLIRHYRHVIHPTSPNLIKLAQHPLY